MGKFGKKPMHFFGALGTLMFVLGTLAAAWLLGYKLYVSYVLEQQARLVTDQPLFYVALTAMVIGVQLFTAGFVAELVGRSAHDRSNYRVKERIGV